AVVKNEVEPLFGDAAIGGKEAVLVALTAGKREADLRDGGAVGRQRACAPDPASFRADRELVEIVARRLKTTDLHMHRMAKLGMRNRGALANHLAHVGGGGYRPVDLDRAVGHAAA